MNCKPRWFQSADFLQEDQTQSFPNNFDKKLQASHSLVFERVSTKGILGFTWFQINQTKISKWFL